MKTKNWVPFQDEQGVMWQLGRFPCNRYTRDRRLRNRVRLHEDFEVHALEAQGWRSELGATGRTGGTRR